MQHIIKFFHAYSTFRFTEIAATFREVQEIFLLAAKKFSVLSLVNTKLFHSVLTLLLYAFTMVEEFRREHALEAEQLTGKMWGHLSKVVAENWIISFFTQRFGNPISGRFQKPEKDIEVRSLRKAI